MLNWFRLSFIFITTKDSDISDERWTISRTGSFAFNSGSIRICLWGGNELELLSNLLLFWNLLLVEVMTTFVDNLSLKIHTSHLRTAIIDVTRKNQRNLSWSSSEGERNSEFVDLSYEFTVFVIEFIDLFFLRKSLIRNLTISITLNILSRISCCHHRSISLLRSSLIYLRLSRSFIHIITILEFLSFLFLFSQVLTLLIFNIF